MLRFSVTRKLCYDWLHLLNSYRQFVTKESIVLEIGASNKCRTKELSRYCYKLVGVEYFPERRPENFNNVEYITGDWQGLSDVISPGSIDIVVASHVIEHVADDLKAINESYIVLKRGGVVLINTPNRKRLTRTIIEFFVGHRKFPHWEHIREYTLDDISEVLDRSKFERFQVIPVCFGLHGGHFFCYLDKVPQLFRKYCNFLEVHLFK